MTGGGDGAGPRWDLAQAWPPVAPPREGYEAHPALSGRLVDTLAIELDGGAPAYLCIAVDDASAYSSLGVIRDPQWRGAIPSDGLTTSLIAAARGGSWRSGRFGGVCVERPPPSPPGAGEVAISGDQTHHCVVAGGVIVKWLNRPDARGHHLLRLEQLRLAGFAAVPRHFAHVTWRSPDGPRAVVMIDEFVPDASDGWQWCLAAAREFARRRDTRSPGGDPEAIGAALGVVVADLHAAFSQPTALVREVVAENSGDGPGWVEDAVDRLRSAARAYPAELAMPELDSGWSLLHRQVIDADIRAAVPLTLTHGDLHIGQVLRAPGNRLLMVDFEGDPLAPGRGILDSPMRDVAHLVTSLALVGQVAAKYEGPAAALLDWARWACRSFLTSYRSTLARHRLGHLVREDLLRLLIAEQVASELVYARTVLPRWAYAPLGAIRDVAAIGILD